MIFYMKQYGVAYKYSIYHVLCLRPKGGLNSFGLISFQTIYPKSNLANSLLEVEQYDDKLK